MLPYLCENISGGWFAGSILHIVFNYKEVRQDKLRVNSINMFLWWTVVSCMEEQIIPQPVYTGIYSVETNKLSRHPFEIYKNVCCDKNINMTLISSINQSIPS